MEWFIERNGSREGPYQAVEVAARVSAGTLPAETPVVSTSGELHLTAGALVAASAGAPAPPPAPITLIPPPPLAPSPRGAALLRLQHWASRCTTTEWTMGGPLLLGFIMLAVPAPVIIAAVLIGVGTAIAIIDIARQRWSRLALAKMPLSRMERWTTSTWIVSVGLGAVGVAWVVDLIAAGAPWWLAPSPYALVYLCTRRGLIAARSQADLSGYVTDAKALREARRGVAGAALVAAEATRNRRDLIVQACGFGLTIVLILGSYAIPGGAVNRCRSDVAVRTVMHAMYEAARQEDVAGLDHIDTRFCPARFREAFNAFRVNLRAAVAVGRKDSAEMSTAIESHAELVRVATSYGVDTTE